MIPDKRRCPGARAFLLKVSDTNREKRKGMSDNKSKGTVITGVIGEDVHVVGIRILEYALGEAGFKVVPLGSQVSQKEFIGGAIEANADAILISSLSGHAEALIPGLREKCVEAGIEDILLYLGGYLVVGEMAWDDAEKKFKAMGIDRVYPPGTSPALAIADLEADISLKRRR
jgi:methylaspartate mutase sigma subunit